MILQNVSLSILFIAIHLYAATVDSTAEIIKTALWQTQVTKYYDPSYVQLSYPNGDVPINRGVCTDVVIRAFRAVDIDLQKLIHEDMSKYFCSYPNNWGLSRPDKNIDHRRVPNITKYLQKTGKELKVTLNGADYLPGDIVTWKLPGNLDHIGIVSNISIKSSDRYALVHNIGRGATIEDMLFSYPITGHYRYFSTRK